MYSFHESTTKRFYFDSVFKKGNLEPTYLSSLISYQAPQTTARLDYVIPQTRLQLFLLHSSGQAAPQPATASPLRSSSKALRKLICFLTGKYLSFLGTSIAKTLVTMEDIDLYLRSIPYWLYHLEQVI